MSWLELHTLPPPTLQPPDLQLLPVQLLPLGGGVGVLVPPHEHLLRLLEGFRGRWGRMGKRVQGGGGTCKERIAGMGGRRLSRPTDAQLTRDWWCEHYREGGGGGVRSREGSGGGR